MWQEATFVKGVPQEGGIKGHLLGSSRTQAEEDRVEGGGGKRLGHQELNSPLVTMDLTGMLSSASTQAVKRRPAIMIIKVPNEEDNTAYQQWWVQQKKESAAIKEQAKDSEAPKPETNTGTPIASWLKPFDIDWTLCAICEV